tara:strand:- start:19 stop:267 length:249 start_codon:yes stop_codon:yes gene_type:complete
MKEKITYLAGALLFGVASWLVGTVYSISIDTAIIKEKLEKVYQDDCPYCIHAAHSSIKEHPLLAPTIKHAHRHVGEEQIEIN